MILETVCKQMSSGLFKKIYQHSIPLQIIYIQCICINIYYQNTIDRWMKRCIFPFPKKSDLGLAKNYRGITLTSIAAKNRKEPKTTKNPKSTASLGKTKMASEEIDPRPHKY